MSAVKPLLPEQLRAADPDVSAWVSASAGTGKTQVLTARVLRLLLAGARPDRLLALTFTKAAAAEMQTRVFETLARWVRADAGALARELSAIGAPGDADTLRRARMLFADALETKGGLKVQTLHSFASMLLAAFPIEAGIAPGFETLDDRSAVQMRADVLADKVARAGTSDPAFLGDLAALAVMSGEEGAQEVIARLLARRTLFGSTYGKTVDWRDGVRRALGVPSAGSREEVLAAALADDAFDWPTVREYAAAMAAWKAKSGAARADTLARALAADPAARAAMLPDLLGVGLKKDGMPLAVPNKLDALHARFTACLVELRDLAWALDIADVAALHLRVGHALAADYDAAKHVAGVLDYDDLIARSARLLADFAASYVLYKLDQRIEHILVDEGQDTNADQWRIVDAIAAEFFAGEGVRDEDERGSRTQFAVGDYKQAIFSFQGTDPREFESARTRADARAASAGKPFETVDLSLSFRSVPAVLDVVDQVVQDVGPAAFGVDGAIPLHRVSRKDAAGEVVLWPPVTGGNDEDDAADEGRVPDSELKLAGEIAGEVSAWLERGECLASTGRPVRAGDILILVRARGNLVPALVSALIKARVEVAGVDRLRLTQPIAVKDMLALTRFALQPGDDLSLAALLVSPLVGWSQEQLRVLATKRRSTLWRALRDARDGGDTAAITAEEWLGDVLARADYMAPYEFFESILSGPLGGRAKLLARLGEEARDPIEELLNQALAYEVANTPSLQGFLSWVEVGDVEVKREAESPRDAVRIMTVHGAKGLQAPIVILADATKGVPRGVKPPLSLELPGLGAAPIFYRSKSELCGAATTAFEAATRAEAEETMRLLYVAMTRAEDRLYVGGALGPRPAAAKSWHGHVADALAALGAEAGEDERWGSVLRYTKGVPALTADEKPQAAPEVALLPAWALARPAAEERPPRPLAPSAAAEDDFAAPPPGAAMQASAQRGKVLHMLFERLGDVGPDTREPAIRAWLMRNAPEQDADAIIGEVQRVMADPVAAAFFGDGALSEAPLTAVVGDRVIAGTIDKLIVGDTLVRALDFKTGLAVPSGASDVPAYHLRQMAAYRDALAAIFPGRRIETALLYTAAPRLIVLER